MYRMNCYLFLVVWYYISNFHSPILPKTQYGDPAALPGLCRILHRSFGSWRSSQDKETLVTFPWSKTSSCYESTQICTSDFSQHRSLLTNACRLGHHQSHHIPGPIHPTHPNSHFTFPLLLCQACLLWQVSQYLPVHKVRLQPSH